MGKGKLLVIICFLFFTNILLVNAEEIVYCKQDSLIFKDYIKQFRSEKDKPINELLVSTAKFFIGSPYVASTLERNGQEALVVNLREFDCTTLVESSMALSLTLKSGDLSFVNYCRILALIRYRKGDPNGYVSRLHYTSDWIYENEKKGLLVNITSDIGGRPFNKPVNFMSTHPHLYDQLKDNNRSVKEIAEIEQDINLRNNFTVLSLPFLTKHVNDIRDGDIIAFATSIAGLDYSHVALAYWLDEELHFIHASSRMKEVVIEKRTLVDYCANLKNCMGISVLRLNNWSDGK